MTESTAARFFRHVNKTDTCWNWTAAKDSKGYGRFWFKGVMRLAHHISWFLMHGESKQLYLMHSCDNPSCVNPQHLSPATHKENMQDLAAKGAHSNRLLDPHKARSMLSEGQTLTVIAKTFGVSKQAVRAAIIRHFGKETYVNRY